VDTFQGIGLPGAMIADAVAGTHGTRDILNNASIGTYLGMTFATVATGGKTIRATGLGAPIETNFLNGLLWGGGLDLTAQATFQGEINWSQAYFSTLAGGLGGVLGGVTAAQKWSLRAKMFANSGGSGIIGSSLTGLQDLSNDCFSLEKVFYAGGISGLLGGVGSRVADGAVARFQASLKKLHLPRNLPDRQSLLMSNFARFNSFQHPETLYPSWVAFANMAGFAIANTGPFFSSPPDDENL
jgi:hypothetical protein